MSPDISILDDLVCERCGMRGLVRVRDSSSGKDVITCPKCSWEWDTRDFPQP